jgi:hypothetical protein
MKILLLLALSFLFISNARWKEIEHAWKIRYFYDVTRIEKNGDASRYWIKSVPDADTLQETRWRLARIHEKFVRANGVNSMDYAGYERYAYTLRYVEIDCQAKTLKVLSTYDYAETEVIHSEETPNFSPLKIVPGSTWEYMANQLCNKNAVEK